MAEIDRANTYSWIPKKKEAKRDGRRGYKEPRHPRQPAVDDACRYCGHYPIGNRKMCPACFTRPGEAAPRPVQHSERSPMFRRPDDPVAVELLDRIERLSKQVAELKGEKEAVTAARKLVEERTQLRTEIEDLKIEQARLQETHDRERREVEHATGLHRKQTEWEREKAVQEARIEVQKGNLEAERLRFESQISFHKEQIKAEIDRLEKLLTALMDRLPTVTVEKSIDFSMVGNGNGGSGGRDR